MFTTFDTATLSPQDSYRIMTGAIVPRPIAWITTVDSDGIVNAAPFSSFNYVGHTPPALVVSIATREGVLKDTARNIHRSGEFVVNVPNEDTLNVMHETSREHSPDESETECHRIELIASQNITTPRIASTMIQFECKLIQAIPFGPNLHTIYLGEVVTIHIARSVFDGRYIDPVKLKPIARLGGPNYGSLGPITQLTPVFKGPSSPNPAKKAST